ncbi:PUA domain-containing protein [Halococcus saccharolyticus]|nr:PUA domain-containing protein [Halococcus saccharolyticus]
MAEELARLRTIADYQFGRSAGDALFTGDPEVRHTATGRPEQVLAGGERLVTYGVDGRFTLGLAGGERLREAFEAPRARVVVGEESAPFVREGKNAFAKFVQTADPAVRPGDEICIVGPDDDLFGVGRAELAADAMADFETGMAVKTREGAD